MSKTVREIALAMGTKADELVKEKQRIRDEFKRQNVNPKKQGNKFVVSDKEAKKIIEALKDRTNTVPSKKDVEKEELLCQIKELKARNTKLKGIKENQNEEIRRLNSKIEKYADDFKDLNDKQLQLNNQQQQLQARILEQTKQLRNSQQELLENSKKNEELQNKVDKVENASLWQRIIKKYE